jgi:hypothetical protein
MEPATQCTASDQSGTTDRKARRRLSTAALGTAATVAVLGAGGAAAPPAFAFLVQHFGSNARAGTQYGSWRHLHEVQVYSSGGAHPKAGYCISGSCAFIGGSAQLASLNVVPNSRWAYPAASYRLRAAHSGRATYS